MKFGGTNWYWLKYLVKKLIKISANKKCEYYAVFKFTAEGPFGPSSTSKVKA